MNPKILKLLMHLRENSRETLTSISKKTNIPISTLFDMLKELDGNIILKNTVLLNFSKLGYHTRAQVLLKVNKEQRDSLRKHLECYNNVNTIYKVNNGWDFMIETVHGNVKELDEFLESLDKYNLENKNIYYLIEEVKKEKFECG